jgi:Protein of unknown function (DUF3040)
MLSERERQQLEEIERGLSSDRRLSARLTQSSDTQVRRRLRWARAVVGFGALLMVAGYVVALDLTVLEGMGFLLAGALWWIVLRFPSEPTPQQARRRR